MDVKRTPGIQRYMEIPEQYPPNKPNFALVVALSAVVLFVVLGLGYLFLRHEAGHLLPNGKPASHARIDLPAQPPFTAVAAYFVAPV
ncbi:MAG TPA: hypothetical protein VIJ79_00950 [Acidobacteriaceae bacterium]